MDDSPVVRNMLTSILEEQCYEVTQANDGAEALKQSEKSIYDLILTDYNMPNMDGLTLLKTLRATTYYKFTPIIILSNEMGPVLQQAGKKAGVTGWITKPFNPGQLLHAIRLVIG